MTNKFITEIARAQKAEYELAVDDLHQLATLSFPAPLLARGYIRYVLVSPYGWVCDTCGERVIVSTFAQHLRSKHKDAAPIIN